MPIYEYSCPDCRRIFQFLARRLQPKRKPVCPKCGNQKLKKGISQFAALKGTAEPGTGPDLGPGAVVGEFARARRQVGRGGGPRRADSSGAGGWFDGLPGGEVKRTAAIIEVPVHQ